MAAHSAPVHSTHHRTVAWATVADAVTYWCGMAAVYMSFGFLWFYGAKDKLFDQHASMPGGLARTYAGSFIDSIPGLNTAWLLLGLVQAVAFLLVVASLAAGEFLRGHARPILMAALGFSMFSFALMAFAQNMVTDYASVASLFTYIGVTAIVIALLQFVAPFRPRTDES